MLFIVLRWLVRHVDCRTSGFVGILDVDMPSTLGARTVQTLNDVGITRSLVWVNDDK